MSSDAKDIKTNQAETVGNESVGDKLGYDKDSKERLPWEHYLQQYQSADPEEIAQRLGISYDKEQKLFTLKFLGTVYFISWPEFEITHEADDMGFYPLHRVAPVNSRLIARCRGERSTYDSLTADASSVWLSPTEIVLRIFRRSWSISTVFL